MPEKTTPSPRDFEAHRTIAANWEEFQRMVISPRATHEQIRATRMAFYGGAQAMLCLMTADLGRECVSEDAGMAILDSLLKESEQFALQVIRGER